MEENKLGDFIKLKQKLKSYLDNGDIDNAKKVYLNINQKLKKVGNISLENMMNDEENENIKDLFGENEIESEEERE